MKERPIFFSGPMVRAILEGRKTQTRRIVKPQPPLIMDNPIGFEFSVAGHDYMCPYGKPGDRLWVRETWKYDNWTEDGEPFVRYSSDGSVELKDCSDEWIERLEDVWASLSERENIQIDGVARDRRWRPSIHMPRWASRINLEMTGVRVELLQDISNSDAQAEGCHVGIGAGNWRNNRHRFSYLWEQINGPGSWDKNPWVWVIEFKRENVLD